MTTIRLGDPIGFGTPAWHVYDKAIRARVRWMDAPMGSEERSKALRSYYNYLQYMKREFRKHGLPVEGWLKQLGRDLNDPSVIAEARYDNEHPE